MGQGQSSSTPGAAEAVAVKTSYYELLGVEREATDEEFVQPSRLRRITVDMYSESRKHIVAEPSSYTPTAIMETRKMQLNFLPRSRPPTRYSQIPRNGLGTIHTRALY
jgi:hypothetical protein